MKTCRNCVHKRICHIRRRFSEIPNVILSALRGFTDHGVDIIAELCLYHEEAP